MSPVRLTLNVEYDAGRPRAPGESLFDFFLDPVVVLRGKLALAHAMSARLDRLTSNIADLADLDADSEQITEAVYSCTDVDAALTILCPHMSKDRPQ